jgi:bifunctional non-homologous end joining protein LigD
VAPDRLQRYRAKRSAERTAEPIPPLGPLPQGNDDTFVVQEHHARRLHWDLRLERGGVLVSWALPKGLPPDPKRNHLAVHTEDHPLEYAGFSGQIPAGEYGGGRMTIWDAGTYECETWTDREVKVVLHGQRARGRYALFRTRGEDWMIHRMDPPPPGWEPMPDLVRPMLATLGQLPPSSQDSSFGYEMKWDGVRAVVYVDGGTVRVLTRNDREVGRSYPELRGLGDAMGSTRAVLDGEIVALDQRTGRISFAALQERMHVQDTARARRLAERTPVTYLAFDVLYLDGRHTVTLPYSERRDLLEQLGIRGPHWDVPPAFAGGGADVLAASREQGLEGVLAKRLTSGYEPGRRSRDWVKVKNVLTQEVVVAGWRPGQGSRAGTIGSLLLGVPGPRGLEFAGQVGTGFSRETLEDLRRRLARLGRTTSPFADPVPARLARDARWVTPRLVGEVQFAEWTRDGRLRHPSWRGLREDKSADEVVREGP